MGNSMPRNTLECTNTAVLLSDGNPRSLGFAELRLFGLKGLAIFYFQPSEDEW